MSIRTKQDWWDCVNENWADLLQILYRFLPLHDNLDRDGQILAHPVAVKVVKLKENQDDELARYFHAAWAAAPDSPGIHRIPCWGVLCDLCSEEYVIWEDRHNADISQETLEAVHEAVKNMKNGVVGGSFNPNDHPELLDKFSDVWSEDDDKNIWSHTDD
jgi:hypothetical protein